MHSFHLQTPCSVPPDKINKAKLRAESFLPLLPPYHLETTRLGSVFVLGPLSQVIWICLTVANKPEVGHSNDASPIAATVGLDGLNFNVIIIYRNMPCLDFL